jgi:hypothetical protein
VCLGSLMEGSALLTSIVGFSAMHWGLAGLVQRLLPLSYPDKGASHEIPSSSLLPLHRFASFVSKTNHPRKAASLSPRPLVLWTANTWVLTQNCTFPL